MSQLNLVIRALESSDREAWNVLWQAYLAFYQVELPDEVTESTWSRLTNSDSEFFAFVAHGDDGEMIGMVHALLHLNTWKIEPRCYLEDLFVNASVRGGGVGRALMEVVYAEADRRGAAGVYWFTNDDNYQARKLYDKIGQLSKFVRYDRA
ncbi:MAG: GNAT family N-acetyltransferase [Rhizobiales bacterium]|nr:GNAT family N-acetyltransferase [Hyphomicrobiales bacterium]